MNLAIWQVEDELRESERRQDFGRRFIELARSVYRNNDRRAAIKRQINDHLGSAIIEEKGYTAYDQRGERRVVHVSSPGASGGSGIASGLSLCETGPAQGTAGRGERAMAKKQATSGGEGAGATAEAGRKQGAGSAAILRAPAETLYADELRSLAEADKRSPAAGLEALAPRRAEVHLRRQAARRCDASSSATTHWSSARSSA